MPFLRRACSRCRTSSNPSSTCAAPWMASRALPCWSNSSSASCVGLAIYDAGSRSFYNVRRPVHEPADLHGLKIRVPPSDIFIATVAALGGNPTPLPFGEVYSAMQTHLIEGARTTGARSTPAGSSKSRITGRRPITRTHPKRCCCRGALTMRCRCAIERSSSKLRARACPTCARCGTRWKPSRARRFSPPA